MTYAMEDEREAQRLERQSQSPRYDYRKELAGVDFQTPKKILDAGCGSGLVTRYIAELNPRAEVTGCDASAPRIEQAKHLSSLKNARFVAGDLTHLPFDDGTFDLCVCRYVLEHLSAQKQAQALTEIKRVLRPGGEAVLVDFDGIIFNIFPTEGAVGEFLKLLQPYSEIDLFVGRKMPHLLAAAGFGSIRWQADIAAFADPDAREEEIGFIAERFDLAMPVIERLAGSVGKARSLVTAYLDQLKKPETVLYYNRLTAVGTTQKTRLRLV